jgi:hypothetical protein
MNNQRDEAKRVQYIRIAGTTRSVVAGYVLRGQCPGCPYEMGGCFMRAIYRVMRGYERDNEEIK